MQLEDGSRKEGTSIFYVSGIEPIVNETGRSYGYKPVKESMPAEFIDDIAASGGCPIKAKASFVIRMVPLPSHAEYSLDIVTDGRSSGTVFLTDKGERITKSAITKVFFKNYNN